MEREVNADIRELMEKDKPGAPLDVQGQQLRNALKHRVEYIQEMRRKADDDQILAWKAWGKAEKECAPRAKFGAAQFGAIFAHARAPSPPSPSREERVNLPLWDKTGMKVEGRFQFRSGCMVRKGNDCGCFLVDTSIETDERSSCTKGEYLSGNSDERSSNPGYGTWEHGRVYELQILELVFGQCVEADVNAMKTKIPAAGATERKKAADARVKKLDDDPKATQEQKEEAQAEAQAAGKLTGKTIGCEDYNTAVENALAGSHPAVYIRGYPSICYGAEECAEARQTDVRTVHPTMLKGGDAKHQERCRCGRRLFVPSVSRSRPLAAPCRFAAHSGDFMAWRRLRKVVHILADRGRAKGESPRRIRPRTCHNPRS